MQQRQVSHSNSVYTEAEDQQEALALQDEELGGGTLRQESEKISATVQKLDQGQAAQFLQAQQLGGVQVLQQ